MANIGSLELKILSENAGGLPLFRVSAGLDTAKSEIAVGKVLEIHNKGVSDTTYRIKPTILYEPGVIDRKSAVICKAYELAAPQSNKNTVVIGSAHRLGVYLARALNSVFLPSQFLSYVKNWKDAGKVDAPAVFGFDFDADPLIYAWIKPHELPESYKQFLAGTKNLILFRSIDKNKCKNFGNHQVHSSVFTKKIAFKGPRIDLPGDFLETSHWEWGVSDEFIESLEQYCADTGKNLAVVESSTDGLHHLISETFVDFYCKNNVAPKRFVFNSYWISHPYYEAETLSIPVCTYKLISPANCSFIANLQKRHKITNADVFMNDFGGDDLSVIKNYLIDSGYFNINSCRIGTDNWDDPASSSRYIATKLKQMAPRKWDFFSFDELMQVFQKIPYVSVR